MHVCHCEDNENKQKTGIPREGAKGALSPGPLGLEGPFRYQNGYYLSVMSLSIANAQLLYRQ